MAVRGGDGVGVGAWWVLSSKSVPGVVAPEGWPRLPMLWGAPLRRHANPNDDSQHRTLSRAPWILSNHLGHARLMSVIGTCVMMPALPHCL